jgi:hypothetical protein
MYGRHTIYEKYNFDTLYFTMRWGRHTFLYSINKTNSTNIEEYCPEQDIILHDLASAIWYTARDNISQY